MLALPLALRHLPRESSGAHRLATGPAAEPNPEKIFHDRKTSVVCAQGFLAKTFQGGVSVRWGVAGPGGIAARFAEAMRLVDGSDIVAVASRSQERADAYGERFGVPRRYADYGALGSDDGVDAVYVAT